MKNTMLLFVKLATFGLLTHVEIKDVVIAIKDQKNQVSAKMDDPIKDPFRMPEKDRNELLTKLVEEGAGCVEIAMRTGFIKICEKDENQCTCKDCQMEFEI